MAKAELAQKVETARDINVAVASRVMGWTQWTDLSNDCPLEPGVTYFADWGDPYGVAVYQPDCGGDVSFYFNPAEDIADAWKVVEKLHELKFSLVIESDYEPPTYHVEVWSAVGIWDLDESDSDSLPLALCRAARLAIERVAERAALKGSRCPTRE